VPTQKNLQLDIYDLDYLTDLFDRMSESYDRMNNIASFGFSQRWRRQFVELAGIQPGDIVCDFMCGRGECWPFIVRAVGTTGQVVGIDLSSGMLEFAERRRTKLSKSKIEIRRENALATELPDSYADRAIMAFGLKTLGDDLKLPLAKELFRILKPGGVLSTIEVSDPNRFLFRRLYLLYLKQIVPVLGRVFLGDPECYRMLGIYTERFKGCGPILDVMKEAGFEAELIPYFYGCATGIVARKPL
jgi:ubiquinone/menaquinone biosynthesis methyltransferase